MTVAAAVSTAHPFGPPISVYTRRQAIEDGVLVDLVAEASATRTMPSEAGLKLPVAITRAAFDLYVWPVDDQAGGQWLSKRCQDLKGRLWDVLAMTAWACRQVPTRDTAAVRLSVIVARKGRRMAHLKAVIGADDDGRACLTIMLPDED